MHRTQMHTRTHAHLSIRRRLVTGPGKYPFSVASNPAACYSSPERIEQTSHTFKSDIWSLGCVLYEMAALHSPFIFEKTSVEGRYKPHNSLYHLVKNIERCNYPPLSTSYSQELRDLVAQTIVIEPTERPTAAHLHKISQQIHLDVFWMLPTSRMLTTTAGHHCSNPSNLQAHARKFVHFMMLVGEAIDRPLAAAAAASARGALVLETLPPEIWLGIMSFVRVSELGFAGD